MVYILNQLVASEGVKDSLISNVVSEKRKGLVLAKLRRLEFYELKTSSGKPQISLQETLTIEEGIGAVAKYRPAGSTRDILILLTQSYKLKVIGYDGGQFRELESLQFDMQGQQQIIDEKMLIVVDNEDESDCFVVHCFQSLVQVFRWTQTSTVKKTSKGNRRVQSRNQLDMKTVSVGNICVKQIVFLENKRQIAVLYRDFDYNFSMRYLEIHPESNNLTLTRQFEEFEGVPSNIVPCIDGGTLVLSSTHIFYFPHPDIRDLDLQTNSNTVFQSGTTMIVKQVEWDDNSGLIESFDSFYALDESRILLVSHTGLLYLIYINAKRERRSLKMKAFSFSKLGMTTIPTKLHHIDRGLFFVSSNMSRSIFFEIRSRAPYINITSYLASSPPIVDIDFKNDNGLINLYTCQGGYHNGEFKRHMSPSPKLAFNKRVEINEIFSLVLFSSSSTFYINTTDGITKRIDFNTAGNQIENTGKSHLIAAQQVGKSSTYVTSSEIQFGDRVIQLSVKLAQFGPDGTLVCINESNEVCAYLNDSPIGKFKTHSEISCCDFVYYDNHFFILIGYWNGGIELHDLTTNKHACILQDATNEAASVHSCCLLAYQSYLQLFISSSEADILYAQMDFKMELDDRKFTVFSFNSLPFKFSKRGYDLFLFNDRRLLYVSQVEHLHSIRIGEVFRAKGTLNDFKITDDGTVVVVTDNRYLTIYSLDNSPGNDSGRTLFTNDFSRKARNFPHTDYSVIMCLTTTPSTSNSDLETQAKLKLVNNDTMEVLDSLKLTGEPVDFDILPDDFAEIFPRNTMLVLSNGANNKDCVVPYTLEGEKLRRLSSIPIEGIADISSIDFSHIRCTIGEGKLLLCGNVTFTIALKESNDEHLWIVEPHLRAQLPIIPVDVDTTKDFLVMADVNRGLFEVSFNDASPTETHKYSLKRIDCEFDPHFLTCLQICQLHDSTSVLITADMMGNIYGLDPISKSTQFVCNIGEQINCIKNFSQTSSITNITGMRKTQTNGSIPLAVFGTVNGCLYSLMNTDDYDDDIGDILSKAQEELFAYSETLVTAGKSKRFKVSYSNDLRGYVSLCRDENGDPLKIDSRGIIDLSIFKKWLLYEAQLTHGPSALSSNEDSLLTMKRSLKTCYTNRMLIEKLLNEASLV